MSGEIAGDALIGATTTMAALEHSPVIRALAGGILAKAASTCGSIQNRNMATVGGNLANASPAADTAVVLLALDAQVVVASSRRKRQIALAEFYSGPHQTVLNGELLEEIDHPRFAQRRAPGLVISKARTHGDGHFPGERGSGITD